MVMHFVRKVIIKFFAVERHRPFRCCISPGCGGCFQECQNHFGNGIAGDGIDTKIVVGPRILAVEFFYDLVYEREFAKLSYCENPARNPSSMSWLL